MPGLWAQPITAGAGANSLETPWLGSDAVTEPELQRHGLAARGVAVAWDQAGLVEARPPAAATRKRPRSTPTLSVRSAP